MHARCTHPTLPSYISLLAPPPTPPFVPCTSNLTCDGSLCCFDDLLVCTLTFAFRRYFPFAPIVHQGMVCQLTLSTIWIIPSRTRRAAATAAPGYASARRARPVTLVSDNRFAVAHPRPTGQAATAVAAEQLRTFALLAHAPSA